jgi:hypothetical protein
MMMEADKQPRQRIEFAYELVLARPPKAAEMQVLFDTLGGFEARYRRDRKSAKAFVHHGDSPRISRLDARELAAYTSIASLILNLDEAVTKQ